MTRVDIEAKNVGLLEFVHCSVTLFGVDQHSDELYCSVFRGNKTQFCPHVVIRLVSSTAYVIHIKYQHVVKTPYSCNSWRLKDIKAEVKQSYTARVKNRQRP